MSGDPSDDSLDAIALVRLARKYAHQDPDEARDLRDLLIGDRTEEQVRDLVYQLAGLANVILQSWHKGVTTLPPEVYVGTILETPETMLDRLILMVVNDEDP